MKKIRVLIVDDSATVRQALRDLFESDPELEVMAVASDPYAAVALLRNEVPDVITLDLEMPRMDGITFLKKLMQQCPLPVVICSSLTERNSATAVAALEAGAVDVITKPRMDLGVFLEEAKAQICDVVKSAAHARVGRKRARPAPLVSTPKLSADVVIPRPVRAAPVQTTAKIVMVGASTGGTEALRTFLQALPEAAPGVVVVQHMPERFTASFAARLNTLCRVSVKEAEDGDPVLPGHVLIAPGNRHTLLRRSGTRYSVEVRDGPLVRRHRPSVDVLFRSGALCAGQNAVGVIMTGMGDDGAAGLLEMREAGAFTIAQNEATCVVFGMPHEAIKLGAVARILPLEHIASEVLRACGL